MKAKLFLLLCLLLPFAAEAQNNSFVPTISPNHQSYWFIPICQLFDTWIDTLYAIPINDFSSELWGNGAFFQNNKTLLGTIRQSNDNSKLYFTPIDEDTEVLIMDLDFSIGDELLLKCYEENYPITVDSIYYLDGKKIIQFDDYIPTYGNISKQKRAFIEGVGPNWGFSQEICNNGLPPFYFICKYDDETLAYCLQNETFANCSMLTERLTNESESEFSFFPNPARTQINVKISEWQGGGTLYVLNAMGLVVASRPISEQEFTLNVSHLANGFYTIVATDDKGRRSFAKFVKEE